MDVTLISPAGTRVSLFQDICSTQEWDSGNTGFNLWDGAAAAIGSSCPPGQATYRPRQPLSAFAGQQPEGTWTLEVSDDTFSDSGTLGAWGVQVSTQSCNNPTPTATVEATGTPTATPEGTFTPTPTLEPTGTATPEATATAEVTPTPEAPEPPVMLDPPTVEGGQRPDQSTEHEVMLYNMGAEPIVWSVYEAGATCNEPSSVAWVSVSPAAGSTAPDAMTELMVTLDSAGLPYGQHSGYLCIMDTRGMVKMLPVSVMVSESAGSRLYLPLVWRK